MEQKRLMYIGGRWVDDEAFLPVRDKYTGRVIALVPAASRASVEKAVAAAGEAFFAWAHTPAHKRSRIISAAADLIEKNKEEIAGIICREAGKAWKYSLTEVSRSVETFRFSAEEAKRIHGETVPMDASFAGEGRFGFWLRSPVGVVAAVTPFNFPLNLVAHKVGPALAVGNTIVLKPASATPLTAIRLVELLVEAGVPAGVVNVVTGGGGSVGEWLVTDPRVAKVSFTGSPAVGEEIIRKAGLKKVTMELGNNSGAIVEPDADIKDAVSRCVSAAFANSGQVCISLQRLYVHRQIASAFTRELVEATAALKVGNPLEKDCDVGPMIDEKEAVRAEEWINEAVSQGARVLCGGRREGAVLYPTILADVRPEMKILCREIFAPVVSLCEYDSFAEALDLLAETPYGLQAGVFTKDLAKALLAVDRLDVGGVMINDTSMFRVDHMPYGGNKLSGLGREGVRFACEEMTNIKMVVIRP